MPITKAVSGTSWRCCSSSAFGMIRVKARAWRADSPQLSILLPAVLARPLVERTERLDDPKKPSMLLVVRGIFG